TIGGTGFVNPPTVLFGAEGAAVVYETSGRLLAKVPSGTGTGVVDVVVTNPDLQSCSYGSFVYDPEITSITPGSGTDEGGTVVVIEGSNFIETPEVSFGVDDAVVTWVSSTVINVVTAPATVPGPVTVEVENSDGGYTSVEGDFTYEPPPSISWIEPLHGKVGELIAIYGTGFQSGTVVRFGGLASPPIVFTDGGLIEAEPPPNEPLTMVYITVENPDGRSFSSADTLPDPIEFRHD
ncbi:unnamed protein product, partial [marine sediment metagenome]